MNPYQPSVRTQAMFWLAAYGSVATKALLKKLLFCVMIPSMVAVRSGTGEVRAWISVAAAMNRPARIADYVPAHCPQTGCGFVYWQPCDGQEPFDHLNELQVDGLGLLLGRRRGCRRRGLRWVLRGR